MSALARLGPVTMPLAQHPKPGVDAPTDAIIRVTKTTIRGTDVPILRGAMPSCLAARILGHEGVAVVDAVGTPTRLGVPRSATIDPKRPITHRLRLQDIPDACDTFVRAAEAKALRLIIETAVA